MDAKSGAIKWQYNPNPSPSAKGVACCDWVNRGGSYAFGNIYYNTLDGFTVAVNATTGKEVYKTKLGDITKGETITMAPLVVKDKVLVAIAAVSLEFEAGLPRWTHTAAKSHGALTAQVLTKKYSSAPL